MELLLEEVSFRRAHTAPDIYNALIPLCNDPSDAEIELLIDVEVELSTHDDDWSIAQIYVGGRRVTGVLFSPLSDAISTQFEDYIIDQLTEAGELAIYDDERFDYRAAIGAIRSI